MKWTEREIGRKLYTHVFARKNFICVPNSHLPGNECDLLVVRPDLRLIDVEIKISRADLKADMHKEKWLKPWDFEAHCWRRPGEGDTRERVDHPPNIWKHYYAMPQQIWGDSLFEWIPATSGVMVIQDDYSTPKIYVVRKPKPNKAAQPIGHDDLIKLMRSMHARMWDAYYEADVASRVNLERTKRTA